MQACTFALHTEDNLKPDRRHHDKEHEGVYNTDEDFGLRPRCEDISAICKLQVAIQL